MEIKQFDNQPDLFAWLVANKKLIIDTKKSAVKTGIDIPYLVENKVSKAQTVDVGPIDKMQIKAVINTTNVMDSHSDVHIPGLWNKSLKDNKNIYFLQEHKMEFDKIIAYPDNVKASTETISFNDLGFKNLEGETEALIFDVEASKDDNPEMFKRYGQGKVKNHSVGMRYVKIAMAINSDDYPDEKAVWDKYYPMIANKKDADAKNYFFAVTEAKVIEGSAVPIGSNQVTPTIGVESKEDNEPSKDTQNTEEPPQSTLYKFFY